MSARSIANAPRGFLLNLARRHRPRTYLSGWLHKSRWAHSLVRSRSPTGRANMAKTGSYKCSACGRTFAMAAHLGRHRNTMHAARKGKKAARKGAGKTAAGPRVGRVVSAAARRRPGPGPGTAGVVGQLRAYRDNLAAQRAQVDSQLAAVNGVLSALGATATVARVTGQRRTPGARGASLRDFIERVLRARRGPMAVKDVTAAILKAGYKSRDKTLRHTVGRLLATMQHVVKVARGQYLLRG